MQFFGFLSPSCFAGTWNNGKSSSKIEFQQKSDKAAHQEFSSPLSGSGAGGVEVGVAAEWLVTEIELNPLAERHFKLFSFKNLLVAFRFSIGPNEGFWNSINFAISSTGKKNQTDDK